MSNSPEALDPASVTQLLHEARNGNVEAEEKALQEVYGRLRRMAGHYLSGERGNHTLQPTALVNEVYLRIFDSERAGVEWQNRDQFFKIAGRAMRQILVDHARVRNAEKRGAGDAPLAIEDLKWHEPKQSASTVDVLDLDLALTELALLHSRVAQVVELKYFAGLTDQQVADALHLKFATVREDWLYAKGWLATRLRGHK